MARDPIPLTSSPIQLDSAEFDAICGWPFEDPFVKRLLEDDIPQRVQFGNCEIWTYRDPAGSLVGFGTLDFSEDCRDLTGGKLHPYIPLLAINPTIESKGYGTSIVNHLVDEAAMLAFRHDCDGVLFLDVYTTSTRAIDLYTKRGFTVLTEIPIPDPQEPGKSFIIMAKRVSIAAA